MTLLVIGKVSFLSQVGKLADKSTVGSVVLSKQTMGKDRKH